MVGVVRGVGGEIVASAWRGLRWVGGERVERGPAESGGPGERVLPGRVCV